MRLSKTISRRERIIGLRVNSEGLTQSGIFDEPMLQAVKLFQQQHTDKRGQPLTWRWLGGPPYLVIAAQFV